MALTIGARLGPYEVRAPLGSGGMGEVYTARDTRLEREVAIKVLPAALMGDPQARERFQREARAIGALQHPNICTIHDIGETTGGETFFVMELLQGDTLQQRLARGGAIDIPQFVDVAIHLADALEAAHGAGIVHRDIKPGNILLTAHGPKILDFGLAKTAPRAAAPVTVQPTVTVAGPVTEPGSTAGTLAYMSPEQLRGEDLDARTDLFSLGLVLYEMATGRPAYTGSTTAVVAAAILHADVLAPRITRPDLPERIEQIIVKALEKDRRLRYQHASDLRADLQRVSRDSAPVAARPMPTSEAVVPVLAQRTAGRAAWLAGVAVAVAAIAGAYVYWPRPPKLTDKDTIVLADFVNSTGDPVFDGTLRQGLAIQLGQSPFLSLVSDARVRQTLVLMRQPPGARLTADLGREVCERTGSAVVLEGSIAAVGTQYVLGLRATNCRTGDVLDDQQVQAARKEDVLNALSQAAAAFRTRAGESIATVERHSMPLPEATTSSLEALKAFSAAQSADFTKGFAAAMPLYRRAVEIDPQFAMAYAMMGLAYGNLGEPGRSIESTARAYQLREHASARERFFITFIYDRQVTGNLAQARETLLSWADTYPRDPDPRGLLSGFAAQGVGEYEQALRAANEALGLDPESKPPHLNLAFNYAFLDRFEEADASLRQAAAHGIEIPEAAILRFYLAFFKDDAAAMDREVAAVAGQPGGEDWMLHCQALVLARAGRIESARLLWRRAADLARQAGRGERAALYESGAATQEAFLGNPGAARRAATEALALSDSRDVEYGVAFALAVLGDSARARALARDLQVRFPEDTCVKFTYVPTLGALVALQAGDSARAIDLLQDTVPYELGAVGVVFNGFFGGLYPAYVRGNAYLARHNYSEAAREYQKLVAHRGIVLGDAVGAMARLQLARAFSLAGDTSKAQHAYEDALGIWKDADADVPIVRQARAELATLQHVR